MSNNENLIVIIVFSRKAHNNLFVHVGVTPKCIIIRHIHIVA